MAIIHHQPHWNANDLWNIEVEEEATPAKMNLRLTNAPIAAPSGFGIYAISHKDESDADKVIYLGSFAGQATDACQGDPRDRWHKHIGSATLLLHNLTIKSYEIYFDQVFRSRDFFANDVNFNAVKNHSFIRTTQIILKNSIFVDGNTTVSSNRLGYGIQNLSRTHARKPNTIEDLKRIIGKFSCHYWKVSPSLRTTIPKATISSALKACEYTIIDDYLNRLPLNDEYEPENSPHRNYYHYDPNTLIELGSADFSKLSETIIQRLKTTFPQYAD
jgi:hypothetical protein